MNAVNTLMSLIYFKSDSSIRNNSEMVSFIYDLFSDCKDIKLISSENTRLKSIAIGVNTNLHDISGGLMFSGHMDTLPPINNNTQPYIKDDKVFGLGAVRMKYFIACLVQALPKLKLSKRPVIIVLSYGQTSTSLGMDEVLNFLKDNHIKPDLCVIGEPTRFDLLTNNDGTYQYMMKVHSNGEHGTIREYIDNPLYVISDFIASIQKLNVSSTDGQVNIGLIEGGRSIHTTPSLCTLYYEVRTHSSEFKENVENIVEEMCGKAKSMNNNIRIENKLLDTSIPAFNNNSSKWIETLSSIAANRNPDYRATTAAGFFQSIGIDTVIYGAGDMGVAHTIDEHIAIGDLEKYTERLGEIVKLYNDSF